MAAKVDGKPIMENLKVVDRLIRVAGLRLREAAERRRAIRAQAVDERVAERRQSIKTAGANRQVENQQVDDRQRFEAQARAALERQQLKKAAREKVKEEAEFRAREQQREESRQRVEMREKRRLETLITPPSPLLPKGSRMSICGLYEDAATGLPLTPEQDEEVRLLYNARLAAQRKAEGLPDDN